jgi:hypothetical protein
MRTTVKMGLASWDQPTDKYNGSQLAGNWQLVDFHDHSPGRGVPIPAGGLGAGSVTANAMAAGAIGAQNLTPALASDLGINAGANTGRGVTNVAAAQSTSSTTPVFLSTPDQVTGITLATSGLIKVNYIAQAKVSAGLGSIGLYINNGGGWVAVAYPIANNATTPVNGTLAATSSHYSPIILAGNAFVSYNSTTTDSTFVTTGMALGGASAGPCIIMAAAGTYSIGVQWSDAAGTITAQNRSLWVETVNFQ